MLSSASVLGDFRLACLNEPDWFGERVFLNRSTVFRNPYFDWLRTEAQLTSIFNITNT